MIGINNIIKLLWFIIFIILSVKIFAQESYQFTLKGSSPSVDTPVAIPLKNTTYNLNEDNLVLYELTEKGDIPIAGQLETGHLDQFWFILTANINSTKNRNFILRREKTIEKETPTVSMERNHRDLILKRKNNIVLKYRHALTYPPDSVNPIFKRSGYIHPLLSPDGIVLTRIQPPDHYHHYGIWGPWTKTHIGDREVDFWNLVKGQGTVKFAGFLSEVQGDAFAGFKALQQHLDFGASGPDQIAMNEVLDVRVWNTPSKNVNIVDYTTTLNSPLEDGIILDAYRYGGGIGFRATEEWHKDNSAVLTSEGKTRKNADGSNARWCIVEGESESPEGRSGILFLSHPSNRMHPEPMRVWPMNANGGRGDMYFEFVPIRYEDWALSSKKDYTLKYRMVIFDGKMDSKTAEAYWQAFANVPRVVQK